MEIIYPPLVEQGFSYHLKTLGEKLDKSELYRGMVKQGIITETGSPTQRALDQGLVKDFYEEENLSFAKFIEIYPVFQRFDQELFQLIDGFWEVPVTFKETLQSLLQDDQLDYDEALQIQEYLADR